VPVGRSIEVQLPAMPTQWNPSIDGDAVRQRAGETVYPSIGQFDGASALIAIPFKAVRRGSTAITFEGTPVPPPWLPIRTRCDSRRLAASLSCIGAAGRRGSRAAGNACAPSSEPTRETS